MTKYYLLPQSPQGSPMWRALHLYMICCLHLSRNVHAPSAATAKGPRCHHHFPESHCHCQGPCNHAQPAASTSPWVTATAKDTAIRHHLQAWPIYPHLPGSSLKPCTCTSPIKNIMASTCWGRKWQASKLEGALVPKILNLHKLHRMPPSYKKPFKSE